MELYRNGLKLTATIGLDESRGSVNVPVRLLHNEKDKYLNYTEQIHIRYLLYNQVKEEILPKNDTGFYIPGKPLSHDGPIELAVHLINGDIELVTNELSFVVKNAPNGTTQVDPSEFTWQQLVDQYVNAKLDTFANKLDLSKFEETVSGSIENQNQNIESFKTDVNANLSNQDKKITDLQNTTKVSLDSQNTKIDNFKSEVNTSLSNQNTSINQTTSAQNSKITTLESRMDTFTSLSEGSTTGDAELKDIRVGANGITYNNAGDAVRGQYKQLKDKITYLETNVTVTDGERGHRTNAVLDMSQPIYVSITPTTTNTFNVFITHGETEVQFLTALDITGGKTYTFEFNREIIDNVAKDYGINAFDDKWRVNIRNATNSKNYKYSIFIKENEKVLNDKKVYVSSTKDIGTFSLVSYACNYLKAKFNNVPCTVFVKNGVYEEKPTNEFPYAPINIANTMINIIGESMDGVIINLTNSSQNQSRIMHIGGFQTIANMTLNVLADSTYRGNNGNNPYVIHNDATYSNFIGHYLTTVENCKLYSECSPPIGAGLHGNQTQIYRNVVFIYNSEHDTGGCLYVHGASNEGQIPDGLIIDGCTAISKNGTVALTLPSVPGYTPYTETPVTIRRTILATNGDTEVDSNFKSTHNLTIDSKLNSNEHINY